MTIMTPHSFKNRRYIPSPLLLQTSGGEGKNRPNKHQHVNHQHTNNIMLNNQEKEATVSAGISIGAGIFLTSLIGILAHIYYF